MDQQLSKKTNQQLSQVHYYARNRNNPPRTRARARSRARSRSRQRARARARVRPPVVLAQGRLIAARAPAFTPPVSASDDGDDGDDGSGDSGSDCDEDDAYDDTEDYVDDAFAVVVAAVNVGTTTATAANVGTNDEHLENSMDALVAATTNDGDDDWRLSLDGSQMIPVHQQDTLWISTLLQCGLTENEVLAMIKCGLSSERVCQSLFVHDLTRILYDNIHLPLAKVQGVLTLVTHTVLNKRAAPEVFEDSYKRIENKARVVR